MLLLPAAFYPSPPALQTCPSHHTLEHHLLTIALLHCRLQESQDLKQCELDTNIAPTPAALSAELSPGKGLKYTSWETPQPSFGHTCLLC